MVIHGMSGQVLKQTGTAQTFSNQAMTDTGDHKWYRIANAAMRYWDISTPVTVQKSTDGGSTWSTVTSGFTIEYPGGNVVFAVANGSSDLIRVSGKYFSVAEWGGFLNWKLDISADMVDATTFQPAGGMKNFLPGLKEISGSAEAYWQDGSTLGMVGADLYIFILYADYGTAKRRYECYGYIKKDSVETPVDAIVKESIDFTIIRAYYREG